MVCGGVGGVETGLLCGALLESVLLIGLTEVGFEGCPCLFSRWFPVPFFAIFKEQSGVED